MDARNWTPEETDESEKKDEAFDLIAKEVAHGDIRRAKGYQVIPHFQHRVQVYRKDIKSYEKAVRNLKSWVVENIAPETVGDYSEIMANLMLTIRCLEDARMRLGKAIQYSGDGESCYDK